MNFASRRACFKCDTPNPNMAPEMPYGKGGGGLNFGPAGSAMPPAGRERWATDWDCPQCGILVFGSKKECFKCGTKNPNPPKIFHRKVIDPNNGLEVCGEWRRGICKRGARCKFAHNSFMEGDLIGR